MLAQSLIYIVLFCLIFWIGYKFIYKPWSKMNLSPEKLKVKKVELQRKKEVLGDIKEEIDVTEDLSKIERELKSLNVKLEKASKKRK